MKKIAVRVDASIVKFEHEFLTDASNEIRLIQVQPRGVNEMLDAPIRVSIKVVTRTEACKEYRALSYQWGDATVMYPIVLNGRLFKVRRILFEFLTHVSRKQSERDNKEMKVEDRSNKRRSGVSMDWNCWWWVDALCIQQDDDDKEKITQIQGMRETYAAAS